MSALSVYYRLPYPARSLAASLHGMRLSRQRYFAKTEKIMAEALARETWTTGQWSNWRQEALASMLWHAARNVPYYRQYWESQQARGYRPALEDLQNWPVLDKETLRSNPRAFLADGTKLSSQRVEHTSGTTGKPLTVFMSPGAVHTWYALMEARWRGWYGLSRHDRWGILGGQMVVSYVQDRAPFWVWNTGMNQLYFSSYHIAPQHVASYLQAIESHRLVYLWGYASSLHSLAQLALEQKLKVPRLRVVISNAEPLFSHYRAVISEAFQCPVYDTYGLSENVCAASECLAGHLHLWPEAGVTEILEDDCDVPVPAGEHGRIVCTGLLNKTMPLIRYEVGDRGFLSKNIHCACGRTLPVLGGIEGRKDDMLLTRDGRRIGRLDPVFKADLPIREAQIIQEDLEHIRVLYVPVPGTSKSALAPLVVRIQERLGEVQVDLEQVEQIPRSANGKFRAVISKCQH